MLFWTKKKKKRKGKFTNHIWLAAYIKYFENPLRPVSYFSKNDQTSKSIKIDIRAIS